MPGQKTNIVEIDLAALRNNFRAVCRKVGEGVRIMAVVKSDAYGHGLLRASKALAQAGTQSFGVATVDEGVQLREAGIQGDIVVLLGALPEYHDAIVHHDLSPVVFDRAALHLLAERAREAGKLLGIHLKVDTGMGRLGIFPEETADFVNDIAGLDSVYLAGFMSHFPLADSTHSTYTLDQCRRFMEIVHHVPGLGKKDIVHHIANSAALLLYPETYLDMVRPGIVLYGCAPGERFVGNTMTAFSPVMRFVSRVIQVKEVPVGYGISYGHAHVTNRPTKLAVLPVGYDDGYLRGLSGRAMVLIQGQRVPILGRICMNVCMADVTDLDNVRVGDEVVLIGGQGEELITVEEVAEWLDTIGYEMLCLIGSKNRRVYVDGEAGSQN